MNVQIRPEIRDGYIRVEVTGHPTLKQLLHMIDALHNASRRWPGRQLLLVFSGMHEPPDRVVRVVVGAYVASRLGHISRIASVVPPTAITGDSERAARRQGGNLRVFSSEAVAEQWLRSTEPEDFATSD